jgi:uncharacterized protein
MREHKFIGMVAIALAVLASAVVTSRAWERVKTRDVHTLDVTGSAKRRITSDLIVWTAHLGTRAADRQTAYRQLHDHASRTLAYLEQQGVVREEIRAGSVTVHEVIEYEYIGTGEDRVQRQVSRGFAANQAITVSSSKVELVERVSREVTSLIEDGVPVVSQPPSYYYTRLGELKIEMLAEASKDARNRAEKMLGALAGGGLGKLRSADMGVININPANSTASSWDGNNDTTSLEKDIITIVHSKFEID